MIDGYHNLVRRLYDISSRQGGKLTGRNAAEYNAIISSLSGFMQLINPGNITGKGALFGDTFADYYWGKVTPEPIDKTLPGFMFKLLDTEELASNFSNSEQVELRRLASKFDKAENFVGYDPSADVDAYTTSGSAALNYSIPIAKSILINRPIVIDPDTLPRLPILIISPSLFGFVGSPTMQKSILSFFFFKYSTTFFVPLIARASSSPVIRKLIEPLNFFLFFKNLSTADIKQAMELFMSLAPLPIK